MIVSRAVSASFLQKPLQILALEAEAAPVAKLRGRNGALACPLADRLLMDTQVLGRFEDLVAMLPVKVANVDERFPVLDAVAERVRRRSR